jgi:uncharacterized protein YkwD
MVHVMVGSARKATVLLAALAAALAVLLSSGPMASSADASACQRWGKQNPARLKHPDARKAIRCLVNAKRRQHNMSGLDRDKRLQRAAQNHSEYMRGHHCFAHQCGGEGSPQTRIKNTGYFNGATRWAWGENIGWGLKRGGTPDQMVDAWMHSPPHREAILSHDFRELGVGFVEGSPHRRKAHGGMYTLDFGLRAG